MEPAKAKVVRFKAKIATLEERTVSSWRHGVGNDAVFDTISMGWYVRFDGSWEALYVGQTKPDWHPGQFMTITISPTELLHAVSAETTSK